MPAAVARLVLEVRRQQHLIGRRRHEGKIGRQTAARTGDHRVVVVHADRDRSNPLDEVGLLVWVAVGMLMERTRLSNRDALAVLRGYAFSHQMTLDVVAAKLTSQDLTIEELAN